ncbi:hypothetical protein [Sessilibacter sp. MAH2]
MKSLKQLPSNVDIQLSGVCKGKIMAEITSLQRQLETYSIDTEVIDIAVLQSYKAMINSRRQWLSGLPVHF